MKVRSDYHTSIESTFYLVPNEYINHQVEIKLSYSLIEWAESIGASTLDVISYILDTNQMENRALQSIFSYKKSERRYSKYEIERACKMVISIKKDLW